MRFSSKMQQLKGFEWTREKFFFKYRLGTAKASYELKKGPVSWNHTIPISMQNRRRKRFALSRILKNEAKGSFIFSKVTTHLTLTLSVRVRKAGSQRVKTCESHISGDMLIKIPPLVSRDPDFEGGVYFQTYPLMFPFFAPAAQLTLEFHHRESIIIICSSL